MAKELKELTPRSVSYSQWYQDLVIKADLAENSAVRGCMVVSFFTKERFRNKQGEIGIYVTGFFEHVIQVTLHLFPDCITVRFDYHATANG